MCGKAVFSHRRSTVPAVKQCAGLAKYYNRSIAVLQIITQMIDIGKDLRNEPNDALSNEERAF